MSWTNPPIPHVSLPSPFCRRSVAAAPWPEEEEEEPRWRRRRGRSPSSSSSGPSSPSPSSSLSSPSVRPPSPPLASAFGSRGFPDSFVRCSRRRRVAGWYVAWRTVLVHVPLVQEIAGLRRKKPVKPKPKERGRFARFYRSLGER